MPGTCADHPGDYYKYWYKNTENTKFRSGGSADRRWAAGGQAWHVLEIIIIIKYKFTKFTWRGTLVLG